MPKRQNCEWQRKYKLKSAVLEIIFGRLRSVFKFIDLFLSNNNKIGSSFIWLTLPWNIFTVTHQLLSLTISSVKNVLNDLKSAQFQLLILLTRMCHLLTRNYREFLAIKIKFQQNINWSNQWRVYLWLWTKNLILQFKMDLFCEKTRHHNQNEFSLEPFTKCAP